jgi:hypothetical protein
VRFNDIDEDGLTWQDTEIVKLQAALEKSEKKNKELLNENSKLKSMLDENNFYKTYKDNEQLKKENESMYILMEENQDLKVELIGFKNISYEQ